MATASQSSPSKQGSKRSKRSKRNSGKTGAPEVFAFLVPSSSQLRVRWTDAPRTLRARRAPTREEIASRAYQLWERRGRQDGHDREDWLIAEADLHIGL